MREMAGERLERLAAQAMLSLTPERREEIARTLELTLSFLAGEESGEESGEEGGGEDGPGQELPPESTQEPPTFSDGRPDRAEESLPLAWVLANASRTRGPFIQLPGVLE